MSLSFQSDHVLPMDRGQRDETRRLFVKDGAAFVFFLKKRL
jgi:hypothetical protein